MMMGALSDALTMVVIMGWKSKGAHCCAPIWIRKTRGVSAG
jgi:hypothetical protein